MEVYNMLRVKTNKPPSVKNLTIWLTVNVSDIPTIVLVNN